VCPLHSESTSMSVSRLGRFSDGPSIGTGDPFRFALGSGVKFPFVDIDNVDSFSVDGNTFRIAGAASCVSSF
jgi:hypothetical protein